MSGDIIMNKIINFNDLNKESVQEDIGYNYRRQYIPWSNEVMKEVKKKSPPESPLKLWWLAEKEKEKNK